MTDTNTRALVLRLAADNSDISNATIKRSLDLLAFLEIEELTVTAVSNDAWGGIVLDFADVRLPQLVIAGYDVTAVGADEDDAVAKLVNAITCAYEADDMTDEADAEEDD